MRTRELRNYATVLAMVLTLMAFAACASRTGGPDSGTNVGGGPVSTPAAAGTQPAVPGTPDNPPGAVEQPASGILPGTAMGGTDSMDQSAAAAKVDCSLVRCAACPDGQTPRLKPPDCCRCVPIDNLIRDCSNVRCAACPEGQHPILRPPDCCRCVAN